VNLFNSSGSKQVTTNASFHLPENRFLIQVKLANLSMYFVHGCRYPVNLEKSTVYKEQNRKADLLSNFPDYIPMAKGVVNDFDETQVLIEIVLSSEEIQNLKAVDKIIFYSGPLPISRVTKLYFASNSAQTSFQASIELYPDAYVPKEICQIISDPIETEMLNLAQLPTKSLDKWKITIDKYDRVLGLIAFLKNATLFFANSTHEYVEYTPGYFQVLSLINNYEDSSQKDNLFFQWIINPDSIEIDSKLARFQFKEILKAVYESIMA